MLLRAFAGLLFIGTAAIAQRTTIRSTTLIDGRGHVLRNQQITIDNGRITAIGPLKGSPTVDLGGLTVMPGWIDTHVHATWYFSKEGRLELGFERGGAPSPKQAPLYAASNMYATLMAGFTTVQSVGAMLDGDLRELIAHDAIPGPRLITSLGQINENTGDPATIRARVDQLKAQGADLIKLFASASIRVGGKMTMSVEQINTACDEAKKIGLRTLVHAYSSEAAKASIDAGCTSIEHGTYLDDATLQLMATKGVYFDPNFLVLHSFLDNKQKFLSSGTITEEGVTLMEKAVPLVSDVLKRARKAHVKVVNGTDAGAGEHGRNAEELIYRVTDGGDTPMDALTSATSVSAESIRMSDKIGSIAVGMEADLVATVGNPLIDITAVRNIAFVMKHGKIYKYVPPQK